MKGATTGILYPGATVKCTYKQNKCNWTFPATSTLLGGGGDIYVPAGIYFPKTIEYKVNIDKGTPDDYKNYISYTGMPSIIPPTSTLCTFFPQDAT